MTSFGSRRSSRSGFGNAGWTRPQAWSVADLVRVLLDLPRPGTLRGTAKTLDTRLLEAWLARDDLRAAIGVNTWEGTDWLDRDRFAAMLRWSARLDAVEAGKAPPTRLPPYVKRLTEAAATAGYRVDALRRARHSGAQRPVAREPGAAATTLRTPRAPAPATRRRFEPACFSSRTGSGGGVTWRRPMRDQVLEVRPIVKPGVSP